MARNDNVAVLDVGSQKITVFIGAQGINNIPHIKGEGEVLYHGFSDGEFFDTDNLREAVNTAVLAAVNDTGSKIKRIYVGVPGEFTTVVCKDCSISFDKKHRISDQDIDELYMRNDDFNSKDYVTINHSAIYFKLDDNRRLMEPRGMSSMRLKALISYVLCERKFIDLFDRILHDLHIKEIEYVPSVWAETMYLFENEQRDKSVLLLDVGHITSSLVLARGDGLLHLSTFSMGGGHIAGDISMCMGIPYAQAETLKQYINLSLNPADDDVYKIYADNVPVAFQAVTVNDIVRERVKLIGEMVNQCISKCEYECPPYLPLYLTGGGLCHIRGAKEIIAKIVSRPVEIVAPPIPQSSRPQFSSTWSLLDIAIKHTRSNTFFKKLFK